MIVRVGGPTAAAPRGYHSPVLWQPSTIFTLAVASASTVEQVLGHSTMLLGAAASS